MRLGPSRPSDRRLRKPDAMISELVEIADYITHMRQEIAALRPNEMTRDRLPMAHEELGSVVVATASASTTATGPKRARRRREPAMASVLGAAMLARIPAVPVPRRGRVASARRGPRTDPPAQVVSTVRSHHCCKIATIRRRGVCRGGQITSSTMALPSGRPYSSRADTRSA